MPNSLQPRGRVSTGRLQMKILREMLVESIKQAVSPTLNGVMGIVAR